MCGGGLGEGRGIRKKIGGEMWDMGELSGVFFLEVWGMGGEGLCLCRGKIVFFGEVCLCVVDLVVYLCENWGGGGMGGRGDSR